MRSDCRTSTGVGARRSPRAADSQIARSLEWQYIGITGRSDDIPILRTKNEVLTIRTTAEVKALLKLAADRESRSAASMVEVLVLDSA